MNPLQDESQLPAKEYAPEDCTEKPLVRARCLCRETHAVAHNGAPMTWKSNFSLVRDEDSPTIDSGFFIRRLVDDGIVAGKEYFIDIVEAT